MNTNTQTHDVDPMVEQRKELERQQLAFRLLTLSHMEEFLSEQADTHTNTQTHTS